jgi:nitroimidazol reductase NimA-like FMN-containing flavoprotein (pyridoxamine 5'-phosphate oxidase superfamily)
MRIEAMTEDECRAVLASHHGVTHLACARDSQPYIVPIHLYLHGEYLYGYSTLGQKIEWMQANPLVCLEVDEMVSDRQWASVIVYGRYEELPDTLEHEESRKVAERIFQEHPMWWEPALVPLAADAPRLPVVFRIRMVRTSGRRATAGGADLLGDAVHTSEAKSEGKPARRLSAALRRLKRR